MAGSSIIVYYSRSGNTKAVADEIQNRTGFQQQRIVEINEGKKESMAKSAMGAFFGLKSRIQPMDFELKEYDRVLLGAQVWAGRTAPAVNTYLQKADFKDKKVWLFITKADPKVPAKVIGAITEIIEKKGGKVEGSISFTSTMNKTLEKENIQDELNKWLRENELINNL